MLPFLLKYIYLHSFFLCTQGWSSKYDEWIDQDSDRISAHYLYTDPASRTPAQQEMAQGIQPTSNVSKSSKLVTSNKKRKQSIEVTQDSIATIPAVSVATAKVTAVPTAAKRKRRRRSAPTQPSSTTKASPVPVPVPATNTTDTTSRRRRSCTIAPDVVDINIDSTSSAVLGPEVEADGVVASPSDKIQPDTTATDVQGIPATVCAGVGEVYKVTTTNTTTTDEDEEEGEEEVGMVFDYESIFDKGMLE